MKKLEKATEFLRRPRVMVVLAGAFAWTLYWVVSAVQDVLTETVVGRGAVGPTLEGWEAMQVVIVSAYSGVRWAAGVALVVGLLVVMGLREHARESSR